MAERGVESIEQSAEDDVGMCGLVTAAVCVQPCLTQNAVLGYDKVTL